MEGDCLADCNVVIEADCVDVCNDVVPEAGCVDVPGGIVGIGRAAVVELMIPWVFVEDVLLSVLTRCAGAIQITSSSRSNMR